MNTEKPYTQEVYEIAKEQGLDLNNWNDYVTYFELGEFDDDYGTWRR